MAKFVAFVHHLKEIAESGIVNIFLIASSQMASDVFEYGMTQLLTSTCTQLYIKQEGITFDNFIFSKQQESKHIDNLIEQYKLKLTLYPYYLFDYLNPDKYIDGSNLENIIESMVTEIEVIQKKIQETILVKDIPVVRTKEVELSIKEKRNRLQPKLAQKNLDWIPSIITNLYKTGSLKNNKKIPPLTLPILEKYLSMTEDPEETILSITESFRRMDDKDHLILARQIFSKLQCYYNSGNIMIFPKLEFSEPNEFLNVIEFLCKFGPLLRNNF